MQSDNIGADRVYLFCYRASAKYCCCCCWSEASCRLL